MKEDNVIKNESILRLPDIYIRRFFAHRQARRYIAHLAGISNDRNFCIVRVKTYARPLSDIEKRARMVANIPQVASHTSWAALERAVAVLSEEAAHLGWHFHVPMKKTRFERYLTYRQETRPETKLAVNELLDLIEREDDPFWFDYLSDIGAKGRRMVFLDQACLPFAYALGIRVQKVK